MNDDQFAAWQKYWRLVTPFWILPAMVVASFLIDTVHWAVNKRYLFGPHLLTHLWGDLIFAFSIIGLASVRVTHRRAVGLLTLSIAGNMAVVFSIITFPNIDQPIDILLQAVQGFCMNAFFGSVYYLWKTRSVRSSAAQPTS